MVAYYNEIDPFAAQWIRELIKAGLVAPGDVDERSIEDVRPDDLLGYTQCHFFAGIGVWSYALRKAGWPDDRPVWTASCPCQPFSAAGAGAGFADERHLWPVLQWLIDQCRPAIVIGEQVAAKAAEPWIDLVQADLEKMGYAFGCIPFPSAGVGAPHIRDRAYWVGHAVGPGLERHGGHGGGGGEPGRQHAQPSRPVAPASSPVRMAYPTSTGPLPGPLAGVYRGEEGSGPRDGESERPGPAGGSGPVNGFWADADWLFCRDGKWRPVEPGTFPLVDGSAGRLGRVRADQERLAALVPRKDQGSRVGRLRGYGNAINAEAARAWIETVMEAIE